MTGLQVMIVDDTSFMRTIMRSFIEDLGHQVVAEASNGIEAVNMYRRVRPELVTMDITMPEMDGISALKKIKSFDSSAKIIMCSAMGQRGMVLDALSNGASDFVVKPIHKDRVVEAIVKIFDGRFNSDYTKSAYTIEKLASVME